MSPIHRRDQEPDYKWQLISPGVFASNLPGPIEDTTGVLAEISEFRGRTLYAAGRRPRFSPAPGVYRDDDPLDEKSFHITVRSGVGLVGCVRVTPLRPDTGSFLGRLVSPPVLERTLSNMGLHYSQCVEAGRWIVSPTARGGGLGRMLLTSMWVVGRYAGARCLLGAVGVRDGQVKMLARSGGHFLPGVAAVSVEEYDDELSIMYFDLPHPPAGVAAQMNRVERLLKLGAAAHHPGELKVSGVSM
jgi:hypothetical protein